MKTAFPSSVATLLLALSCGGGETPPPATAAEAATVAPEVGPPATFAEQVTLGRTLYAENCAKCHGDNGEGTKGAPAVVGLDKGALPLDPPESRQYRKSKFETVADVADFVVKNMPPNKAGTLTAEQYYAILAFDLKANGIELDKKLDGDVAQATKIPRAGK